MSTATLNIRHWITPSPEPSYLSGVALDALSSRAYGRRVRRAFTRAFASSPLPRPRRALDLTNFIAGLDSAELVLAIRWGTRLPYRFTSAELYGIRRSTGWEEHQASRSITDRARALFPTDPSTHLWAHGTPSEISHHDAIDAFLRITAAALIGDLNPRIPLPHQLPAHHRPDPSILAGTYLDLQLLIAGYRLLSTPAREALLHLIPHLSAPVPDLLLAAQAVVA